MRVSFVLFLVGCSFCIAAPFQNQKTPLITGEQALGYAQAMCDEVHLRGIRLSLDHDGRLVVTLPPQHAHMSDPLAHKLAPCAPVIWVDPLQSLIASTAPNCIAKQPILTPPTVQTLPIKRIAFPTPLADPRQQSLSVAYRTGKQVLANALIAVSFGDTLAMRHWKDRAGAAWQWGIGGAVWATFDITHGDVDLYNSDWMCTIPVVKVQGPWSTRYRLYHVSSHLGDEFMVRHPEVARYNPSYEAVDIYTSYRFGDRYRLYGGIGYIFRTDRIYLMRSSYGEGGFEVYGSQKWLWGDLHGNSFFATHVRTDEDHNFEPSAGVSMGIMWQRRDDTSQAHRVITGLDFYKGFSVDGQFSKQRSSFFGVKIAYCT